MSSDNGGNEEKGGDSSDAPAESKEAEMRHSELQAFIQESQSRWHQYDRDQASKSRWEKGTAIAVWLYTLLTLAIVRLSGQQFIVIQDQERAQLRPYVIANVETVTPFEVGKPVGLTIKYQNVGNTPVYQGRGIPYQGQPEGEFFFFTNENAVKRYPPACASSEAGETIGKEATYTINSSFSANKSQADLIMAGPARIIFISRYCYSDIFKEVNWVDTCVYWAEKNGSVEAQRCNEYYNQSVSNASPITNSSWWPDWLQDFF